MQIAYRPANMTPDQISDILYELQMVNERIRDYVHASEATRCQWVLTEEDSEGIVTIRSAPDGSLEVTCR